MLISPSVYKVELLISIGSFGSHKFEQKNKRDMGYASKKNHRQERVLAYHETTEVQAHQWPRLERLHSHTVCVPESTQEAMPCPSLLRQGGLIRRQVEREVRVRLGDSSI